MKNVLKKTLFIILLVFWGLLIMYTGSMSFFFSLGGDMWISDTGLMVGYVGIFFVLSLGMVLMILRTNWFTKILQ